MLKILTGIGTLKEIQSAHGKLLQQLLRQGAKPPDACDLPASIKLPLTSPEEADALEAQLEDNCLMTRLVSYVYASSLQHCHLVGKGTF